MRQRLGERTNNDFGKDRRYYEEINDVTADGVGYAMLDGIAFLRDTLERVRPATVAALVIG